MTGLAVGGVCFLGVSLALVFLAPHVPVSRRADYGAVCLALAFLASALSVVLLVANLILEVTR